MYRNLRNVNSSFVRDVNTNLVLNAIRVKKTISRTDLARLTSLSYPTVSTIVKHLMSEGFISEAHIGNFRGGRKPMILKFNPDARQVIGLDLSGSVAQAVLADLDGEFVSPVINGESLGAKSDLVEVSVNLLKKLREHTGFSLDRILGIGASLRGSFDLPKRLFYYAEDESIPFKLLDGLESHYQVPIIMDHISNVALLAERLYGVAKDEQNAAYVNVGSGISAGLLFDGNIYRGALGNAGEIGHIKVKEYGEPCPDCGRIGCLENVSSIFGIMRAAENAGYNLPKAGPHPYKVIEILADAARKGNSAALAGFKEAAWGLATGLTDMVNMLNPDKIILGGKVVRVYPEIVSMVSESVLVQCWPFSRENLLIVPGSLSENILLRGAISLVLSEVFLTYGITANKSVILRDQSGF